MLSLAAIKYRRVLAEAGGPIAKIVSTPVLISGRATIQANAFLTPGLAPRKPGFGVAEQADGAGSSDSPRVACYIAISEALERWAFLTEYSGPNARRYGIIANQSSAGMAAFPGLFKVQARRRARLEALERLALISWWDGRCTAWPETSPHRGINLLRLHHGAWDGEVVVVYRKSKSGHVSYGWGAGETLPHAVKRAIVKLTQNEFNITCHKLRARSRPHLDFFERRCLHFASPEGYQEFLTRVNARPTSEVAVWDALFDGEMVGPWSRYATVWRTSLKMPTDAFLNPAENFFFW